MIDFNNKNIKIAIDGPAGSGKSSVAKVIADKLNIEHIDSGAIYRTITKIILDRNLKISLYDDIKSFVNDLDIQLLNGKVIINGVDFYNEIRTNEVTRLVSPVSSIRCVREKVNQVLNSYSRDKSVIMDGRDITTVVFPNADYKFYLDASVEARARRRYLESDKSISLDEIMKDISKRDHNDKTKEFGALLIADDAIYIDTTELTFENVVNKIVSFIKF